MFKNERDIYKIIFSVVPKTFILFFIYLLSFPSTNHCPPPIPHFLILSLPCHFLAPPPPPSLHTQICIYMLCDRLPLIPTRTLCGARLTPLPFSFHSMSHNPPTHTHSPTYMCAAAAAASFCTSATRRRRASSGRPGMISPMVKGRMRKTGEMKGWKRRTTTTLNFAGCARMEESCCAVTPAPPPTTSTASTLPSQKSLMENGSAPAAR